MLPPAYPIIATSQLIRWVLVLAALASPLLHLAHAEERSPVLFAARNWRVEHGLPHNNVNGVVQDSAGFLWIACGAGLSRFDGISFTEYPLPKHSPASIYNVRDLTITSDGRLLILPASGGVWEMKNGALAPHPATEALGNWTLLEIFAEPGGDVLWFGATEHVVYRWEKGKLETFGSEQGITRRVNRISFAHDTAGRTWVASGEFLGFYREGKLVRPNVPLSRAGAGYLIGAARSGGIWLATSDRLMKLDNDQLVTVSRRPEWIARGSGVQQLMEDRRGVLWIGTRRNGIFQYADGKISRTNFEPSTVLSLLEDQEGNVWAGTTSDGLVRLRPRFFTFLNSESGLRESISSAVAVDPAGAVWLANRSGGLVRVRGKEVEFLGQGTRLPLYTNRVAVDARGEVWAAGDSGMYRCSHDKPEQMVVVEPAFRAVQFLFPTSDGKLWLASTAAGLGYFENNVYKQAEGPDGPFRMRIDAIAEDREGKVWLATQETRGTSLDVRLWQINEGKVVEKISRQDWSAGQIFTLHFDKDGMMWLGTAAGLFLRDGGRFYRIHAEHGLPDELISEILEDDAGRLWCGTRRGFIALNIAELRAVAKGAAPRIAASLLGADDGLRGVCASEIGQPRTAVGSDGRLWFATQRGVLGLDPHAAMAQSTPPRVYLEQVRLDGKRFSPGSAPLPVPPRSRRIQFDFAVLNYAAPESVQVKYRLEGYDEGWTLVSGARTVAYPELRPGHYRFQVIAANESGVWNMDGAGVVLAVQAAWWQTWIFWVLAVTSAAALGVWVVRSWTLRKMRRKLEVLEKERALHLERARIARNLHDELGGSLTQISLLAERLKRHSHQDELGQPLSQLAGRARALTGELESIVWTINPQNDSWDRLALFLAQLARRYFRDTEIECVVSGAEAAPDSPISPEDQHNVLALTKEALNNVLKHARATRVQVSISFADGSFALVISDNGVGFDPSRPEHAERNGLTNMRVRGEESGGECRVESRPNVGTTVRLTVPLRPMPVKPV